MTEGCLYSLTYLSDPTYIHIPNIHVINAYSICDTCIYHLWYMHSACDTCIYHLWYMHSACDTRYTTCDTCILGYAILDICIYHMGYMNNEYATWISRWPNWCLLEFWSWICRLHLVEKQFAKNIAHPSNRRRTRFRTHPRILTNWQILVWMWILCDGVGKSLIKIKILLE